jgi:N-acetyl-gamma-glutamyl-phosphate reductase
MTRGILSTCYAQLRDGVRLDREGLKQVYRDFYRDAPFVHVSDTPPSTKHVAGTNYCIIHPSIDNKTGRVVIAGAIDNLGKGAAGNAVQCFNIMQGLPETTGLQSLALFP